MTNPYAHIEVAIQMYREAIAVWEQIKQRTEAARAAAIAANPNPNNTYQWEARYKSVREDADYPRVTTMFNDLLNHFMTTFPLTAKKNEPHWAVHLEECRKVFYGVKQDGTSAHDISYYNRTNNAEVVQSGYDFCQRMYDIPPTILQEIIVVACLRDALGYRRIPFNPNEMPAWNAFAERYCDVILAA